MPPASASAADQVDPHTAAATQHSSDESSSSSDCSDSRSSFEGKLPPVPAVPSGQYLFQASAESRFPSMHLVRRMLGRMLCDEYDLNKIYASYGLLIQTSFRRVFMEPSDFPCPVAYYEFPIVGATDLDFEQFPNVLRNALQEPRPPFNAYHGTQGKSVPCILAGRMVRRSSRLESTLDGWYSVNLSTAARCTKDYTTEGATLRALFRFDVRRWKKCKNFSTNRYLIAHESWLKLRSLVLMSLGAQIRDGADFLAPDDKYSPEPRQPIPGVKIPDNWDRLSDDFLSSYG